MERKHIALLVGPSGSGKTTVANYLHQHYGYKIVESYTDRPPRYAGEGGHRFVSVEEFDMLPHLCAFTEYDGHRYGATDKQVDAADIYVIDAAGVEYFRRHFHGERIPVVFELSVPSDICRLRMKKRGDSKDAIEARLALDAEIPNVHADVTINGGAKAKDVAESIDRFMRYFERGGSSWTLTDDDCEQHRRTESRTRHRFMQIVHYPGDEFAVVGACVDLTGYEASEIADCLASYGYSLEPTSGAECIWNFGRTAWALIAECLFETECMQFTPLFKGNYEQCAEFIHELIWKGDNR